MMKKIWHILPDLLRWLILAWLASVLLVYFLLPNQQRKLEKMESLRAMSISHVVIMMLGIFVILCILSWKKINVVRAERCGILLLFVLLSVLSLKASFTVPFLCAVILVCIILGIYVRYGQNLFPHMIMENSEVFQEAERIKRVKNSKFTILVLSMIALLFFLFISLWTVCRVLTYSSPSFDFGIFSQMFYYMRTTGLPNATIERDGLLSHFNVHVSPIYYLMLPFYCFYPEPVTLQILQAAVLTSAVIPVWKLARSHGCTQAAGIMFVWLLLLYPAYSGGAGYDLHENAFLTPLLLWLFYAIDSRKGWAVGVLTVLTLMVKEDAAIYAAVIGLWLLLRSLFDTKDCRKWNIKTGCVLLTVSLIWFTFVTGYLDRYGDGVMTNRYSNLIYDDSGSLLTVVKALFLSPMKVLYECADMEKIGFILLTMAPFCGMPLMTRRYERYILLIPYILVNLMSDYRYQHDIFFQYTYGPTACLFYLTIVNYADMAVKLKNAFLKYMPLLLAVTVSAICFGLTVVPVAVHYPASYISQKEYYKEIGEMLALIPDDASATATTFYTVPLSSREILYDVRYSSEEHLLSTEYVVLEMGNESCYTRYAETGNDGYDNLVLLLEENGYELVAEMEDTMTIFRKIPS